MVENGTLSLRKGETVMTKSDLDVYAKAGVIVEGRAQPITVDGQVLYSLLVTVSLRGVRSVQQLRTARKEIRSFKSLDTLAKFWHSLPHSQGIFLFIATEVDTHG